MWLESKTGCLSQPHVALTEGTANTDPKPHPSRNVPGSTLLASGSLARGECIQDAVMESEKKPGMSIFILLVPISEHGFTCWDLQDGFPAVELEAN